MEPSLLRIEFDLPHANEPLFFHEAIYKSFKGLYHDMKEFCLTTSEYNDSKPLFLYSIERGSADWAFLLDPNMIPIYVQILLDGFSYYSSYDEQILNILKEIKSTVSNAKIEAFMKQPNSKIIFENLNKFNPKKITIKTKLYSNQNISKEEEITIHFDKKNDAPKMF
jgi:hypothetical protein